MSARLWTQEQFNCPICLDLPNDPVTIPCGHSYCIECIKDYWTNDDHIGIYNCPQCRQTFCPKPSLSRNTMLAEAVEQMKCGRLKSQPSMGNLDHPSPSSSSLVVVLCDVCEGSGLKKPAVKTCLVCLASYCELHLKPHKQAATLKRHELVNPTHQVTQKICSQHKYLQEFYCRACHSFICWLCVSNQHKEHDTVSTQAERVEKQKGLGAVQSEYQQKLHDRERELNELKKVMNSLKNSADRVRGDTQLILSELQHSVARLQTLVVKVMDSSAQDKLTEAQDMVTKLEAEITELKRRNASMGELVTCEDNIHFLQNFQALCSPLETGELSIVTAKPEASFEPVLTALSELRENVEDMCNKELGNINKIVNDLVVFSLGDSANKNTGQNFKFEFFKLFSGLGRTKEKCSPGTSVTPVGIRNVTRVSGDDPLDVRSREEIQGDRQTLNLVLAPIKSEATKDVAPIRQGHAVPDRALALNPNAGGGEKQHGGKNSSVLTAAVGLRAVNPSLFLDTPKTEVVETPLFTPVNETLDRFPEPKTRTEFLRYACRMTLDPDTAHRRLFLSEGNMKATLQASTQPVPDLPQRFVGWTQVLCKEPLLGNQCYWEVEWRGRGCSVGVAYAALERKGMDARAGLGYNMVSWSLEVSDTYCSAMHHNQKQDIAIGYSPRIGVYLNRPMGTLAFYSVSDNMMLLHMFHTSFVEPLYPAFGVGSGVGVGLDFALGQFTALTDSVKICAL